MFLFFICLGVLPDFGHALRMTQACANPILEAISSEIITTSKGELVNILPTGRQARGFAPRRTFRSIFQPVHQ